MCFRPANLVLNKTCPECGNVQDASIDECEKCGYNMIDVEMDMPDMDHVYDVVDPSDIGKPSAPAAPAAPTAPKAPGM